MILYILEESYCDWNCLYSNLLAVHSDWDKATYECELLEESNEDEHKDYNVYPYEVIEEIL